MDELVQYLSKEDRAVEASRADGSVDEFKKSIEIGYVHIKFTDTDGGTEVLIKLDRPGSDLSKGDFDSAKGTVHLVGNLSLNYAKVRCVADLDLSTLEGLGHLEIA